MHKLSSFHSQVNVSVSSMSPKWNIFVEHLCVQKFNANSILLFYINIGLAQHNSFWSVDVFLRFSFRIDCFGFRYKQIVQPLTVGS